MEQTREVLIKAKCEEMERIEKEGKYELMYRISKEQIFEWKKKNNYVVIKRWNGTVRNSPYEVLDRWKQHIQCPYEADQRPIEIRNSNARNIPENYKGYVFLKEVTRSMAEMKNCKACGIDELPVEVQKNWAKEVRVKF